MSPLTEPTRLVLAKGQPVANDPFLYTNTVLLLHGDGTNGSTSIIDSSRVAGGPKTVTAVGNAQISTAQSKFGGASIAFDGTGDYLTAGIASNWAFLHNNTKSWTIELWHYTVNSSPTKAILETASITTTTGFTLYNTDSVAGDLACYITRGVSGSIFLAKSSGSVLQSNAWQHIAVVFVSGSSSSLTIYLNGQQVATASTSSFSYSSGNPTNTLNFGRSFAGGGSTDFSGYLDEIRITEGVARYTANFTPPTAPFPDF